MSKNIDIDGSDIAAIVFMICMTAIGMTLIIFGG